MDTAPGVVWHFVRIGGLNQVTLRSSEELRALRQLDPKLWAALSCPASGIELDPRMLALIDTDHDGRIRIPEVIAAVEWACLRLTNPAGMADGSNSLPLSAIRTDTEEGRQIVASARALLEESGRADADALSQEEVRQAAEKSAQSDSNGDGIIPALPSLDEDVRRFVEDALAFMGGEIDASGKPGVNKDIADAFIATLEHRRQWYAGLAAAADPLGEAAPEAFALLQKLRGKIDDYFLRCALATFAPNLTQPLNVDGSAFRPEAAGLITSETLADFPLSHAGSDKPLCLTHALNPAWQKDAARFAALIAPLLAEQGVLTHAEWAGLTEKFDAYALALQNEPAAKAVQAALPPTAAWDALPAERLNEILDSGVFARFNEIRQKDADAPISSQGIADVERLVLYYKNLHRLLMNFVSFYDFYSMEKRAVFQDGRLYLDGRCCKLCLPVDDVEKHAGMASFSQFFLVYCTCVRKDAENAAEPERMTIVAVVTDGDADLLIVGRNGLFVDDQGNDWDATVIKTVSNPIGLREALWAPYKRMAGLIGSQVGKFAGKKQAESIDALRKKVTETTSAAVSGTPAAFDIGKNVGIFAAIGLALGALGTALAAIARALLSLSWWQFPLLFLTIFLLISGPSLFLARLKLRKRTIGPLLEASGWAVNNRLIVDLPLGNKLTDIAALPPNAKCDYTQGLKKRSLMPLLVLSALLLFGGIAGWFWYTPDRLAALTDAFTGVTATTTAPVNAPPAVQTPKTPAAPTTQ